jgi:NADPH-dependent ferric siderophore reductase
VPLTFDALGNTITATAPATSNIAPAGYYMLFITDNAGIPSVAKIIRLQQKPAVKGASSDFNGDGFSDAVVADPYADPRWRYGRRPGDSAVTGATPARSADPISDHRAGHEHLGVPRRRFSYGTHPQMIRLSDALPAA